MGTLRPGATIVYETPDNGKTIYGRYEGETERFIVGQNISTRHDPLEDHERNLWYEIRQTAKTDPALQKELDRVKSLYYLKLKDKPLFWHPV